MREATHRGRAPCAHGSFDGSLVGAPRPLAARR